MKRKKTTTTGTLGFFFWTFYLTRKEHKSVDKFFFSETVCVYIYIYIYLFVGYLRKIEIL